MRKDDKSFALLVADGGGTTSSTSDIVDTSTNEVLVSGVVTESTVGQEPTLDSTPDVQRSVMGEFKEAFDEMGTEFLNLKTTFANFGITLGNESANLGDQLELSLGNIKNKIMAFTQSIKKMGDNLSNTLNPT